MPLQTAKFRDITIPKSRQHVQDHMSIILHLLTSHFFSSSSSLFHRLPPITCRLIILLVSSHHAATLQAPCTIPAPDQITSLQLTTRPAACTHCATPNITIAAQQIRARACTFSSSLGPAQDLSSPQVWRAPLLPCCVKGWSLALDGCLALLPG